MQVATSNHTGNYLCRYASLVRKNFRRFRLPPIEVVPAIDKRDIGRMPSEERIALGVYPAAVPFLSVSQVANTLSVSTLLSK
jgi:hypothetical protein